MDCAEHCITWETTKGTQHVCLTPLHCSHLSLAQTGAVCVAPSRDAQLPCSGSAYGQPALLASALHEPHCLLHQV